MTDHARMAETCRKKVSNALGDESRSTRDLLHRMEKLRLITRTELWMEMRDVRNRIVHDYLPKQIKAMYDDIMGPFGVELRALAELLTRIKIN